MTDPIEEIALSKPMPRAWLPEGERSAVYRRGDTIVRAASPWTPSIHALLRHLEDVGFDGAPRLVGIGIGEDGREVLGFIEGEFMHPGSWTLDGAYAVGRFLKSLHRATASFQAGSDMTWSPWLGRDIGDGSPKIISHCDVAPWNIVARDGLPVALIDWEYAGPVEPLVELAQACWLNAKLHSDDVAEREGLGTLADRAKLLRAIVDGYELPSEQRKGFIDRIIQFVVCDTAEQADEVGVTPETMDSEPLWGMAWRARAGAWIVRNRKTLEQALER